MGCWGTKLWAACEEESGTLLWWKLYKIKQALVLISIHSVAITPGSEFLRAAMTTLKLMDILPSVLTPLKCM